MNFKIRANHLLAQAKAAYQNFDGFHSAFAAIRLNIALPDRNGNEIDEIVEDNFRRKRDLIFKNDDAYLIFMQDATLEVAERVTRRLKFSLALCGNGLKNAPAPHRNRACAYILGPSRDTKRWALKYVDLSASMGFKTPADTCVPSNLQQYLRWLNLAGDNGFRTNPKINIKI